MSEQTGSKSMLVAYLLWFFLGGFGAHRFYMGRTRSGFGMLGLCVGSLVLTMVVVGFIGLAALFVWAIVDAFLIPKWMEQAPPVAGSVQPTLEKAA